MQKKRPFTRRQRSKQRRREQLEERADRRGGRKAEKREERFLRKLEAPFEGCDVE